MIDAPPIVGSFRMVNTEALLFSVDFTADLDTTETLSSPASKLTDMVNGANITLGTSPSINVKSVRQRVDASTLTAGHLYHLTLTGTSSGGNTWSGIIEIEVVS